eukprot:PITA_27012
MQDRQVVCYESRKLNEHEQNYLTHDIELGTIIHALKMWRHYLIGRRFVLMSDYIRLRYFFDQLNLNVRQARWLASISEFDFEIRYIKGKKNRVADSLSRWIQVKAKCKHPGGMLQPIAIPEWKWEVISMDFITGLLRTVRHHDSIMVIVDRLTKAIHFIPMKSTFSASDVAHVFIRDVVRLHRVSTKIVLDKDAKFTSKF